MKYLSVCSGIEAATVAWHDLGWTPAAFSEIESFPSAVLQHHYPDVPNAGDMTRFEEWSIGSVDLLVGGTPCQAFSVAGLRRGLADARGNLSLTFCQIADHFDPEWTLWENVPGVLSSRDNAFGCFLAGLCGAGQPIAAERGWPSAGVVSGPRRTVAWRVLDAQFFGVAQRRRRVFVLAVRGARNWVGAAALFPVAEGLRWNSAPSREAGQEVAGTFTARAKSGGWGQDLNLAASGYMRPVCPTLRAGGNSTGGDRPPGTDVDTADSLIVQPYAVANCLTARMHKGINSTLDEGQTPIISPTITATNNPSRSPQSSEVTQQVWAVMQAVAFQSTADCLTAAYGTKWNGNASADNGSLFAKQAMQVRRLTPVECERLQGFPDGYTNIPWRGKPESPDGPRYKALGNSMAVPVMRWIGERIEFIKQMRAAA